MIDRAIVIGLGNKGAMIASRCQQLWEGLDGQGRICVIGASEALAVEPEACFEWSGPGASLPREKLLRWMDSAGEETRIFIVAAASDPAAYALQDLVRLLRKSRQPESDLQGILILGRDDMGGTDLLRTRAIVQSAWPEGTEGLSRLFLVENFNEGGGQRSEAEIREAIALRLAFETSDCDVAFALRARSNALAGSVRTLGGAYLDYQGPALARLVAIQLLQELVAAWYGGQSGAGAGQSAVAGPTSVLARLADLGDPAFSRDDLEIELDERIWCLRAEHPGSRGLLAALPGFFASWEEYVVATEAAGPLAGAKALVDSTREDCRAAIDEAVSERLAPSFLGGEGLVGALALLKGIATVVQEWQAMRQSRYDGLIQECEASSGALEVAVNRITMASKLKAGRHSAMMKAFQAYRNAALELAIARALRAGTKAQLVAWARLENQVERLTGRLESLSGLIASTGQVLARQAQELKSNWQETWFPSTRELEQVLLLQAPSGELLGLFHERITSGSGLLGMPVEESNPEDLVCHLRQVAEAMLPELNETNLGAGMQLICPSQPERVELVRELVAKAAPMLRLSPSAANKPGTTGVVVGHEVDPPAVLQEALLMVGVPSEDCVCLPASLANRLMVWSERSGIKRDEILGLAAKEAESDPAPSSS